MIAKIFSTVSENSVQGKTLMSELAGKNLVPLNSDKYWNGIDQFETNLEYMLKRCDEENINTIVGTLASNLMQSPLCRFTGCETLFEEFKSIVKNSNNISKERLVEVKDEDKLRFRAPEEFNKIIFNLHKKYNFDLADVKNMLENNSPNGIIGDNLMLDHLHPSIKGNDLIADLLLESMTSQEETAAKLSAIKSSEIKYTPQVFQTYTRLDSSFAELRIKHLKSDFPFVKQKRHLKFLSNLESIEDKLAKEIIEGEISWESAHAKLAKYYLENGNLHRYLEELNVLIEDKPFDNFFYLKAIKTLEAENQIEPLKYFLHKYYNYFSDSFSASKLGQIYFNERNHQAAIFYYEKCISETSDPQVFFNLSASYYSQKNLPHAMKSIQKCLELNPNYPNAEKIYNSLVKIYNSRK